MPHKQKNHKAHKEDISEQHHGEKEAPVEVAHGHKGTVIIDKQETRLGAIGCGHSIEKHVAVCGHGEDP